jgi:hypothetical protein
MTRTATKEDFGRRRRRTSDGDEGGLRTATKEDFGRRRRRTRTATKEDADGDEGGRGRRRWRTPTATKEGAGGGGIKKLMSPYHQRSIR